MSENENIEEVTDGEQEHLLTADEMIALIEGKPLKKDKNDKKSSPWHIVNYLIIILGFLGACWFLAAANVEMYFVAAILVMQISALVLNGLRKKWEVLKKPVIALRVGCFLCLGLMIVTPIMFLTYEHSSFMYGIRKLVFSGHTHYAYLPDKLPEKCDDLTFIIQAQVPAQDYHPSAFLAFYTDENGLNEYREDFLARGYEPKTFDFTYQQRKDEILQDYAEDDYIPDDEDLEELVIRSFGVPSYAWSRFKDNYSGCVVSPEVMRKSNKGMLLDYETGFVLIWT